MTKIIKSVECPQEKIKAGGIVFKENSASDCFFIIRKGKIEVFKHYGTPKQVLLATIDEGKVLGEISGIDGLPRTATAVAKTDVEITKVSSETLKYQLKQCPGWFRAIILDLVARLRNTNEMLVAKGVEDANSVSSQKATADTNP
ncbi:MAG TPA: cyclic nucleotide-binding domain-containing protein [Bdellovibrionota bacterium]|jgi:CRP-like cAMP-binding protein|nr:cyclic nucleotide-binding domain-containing protein [Bdellovibrionota bacterium]